MYWSIDKSPVVVPKSVRGTPNSFVQLLILVLCVVFDALTPPPPPLHPAPSSPSFLS